MLNKIRIVRLVKAIKLFSIVNTAGMITFVIHIIGGRFGKRTGDGQLHRLEILLKHNLGLLCFWPEISSDLQSSQF